MNTFKVYIDPDYLYIRWNGKMCSDDCDFLHAGCCMLSNSILRPLEQDFNIIGHFRTLHCKRYTMTPDNTKRK